MTWVTAKEAAKLVGRPRSTIYNWINAGRLRTRRGYDGSTQIDGAHLLEVEPTITRGRPTGTATPPATRR